MESDLEIIYTAANIQQASLLRGILADEGIQATVTNIALQDLGVMATSWNSSPCVLVRREDVEVARALAVDFDETVVQGLATRPDQVEDEFDAEREDDEWDHHEEPEKTWPPCPSCNTSRRGRCPNCGSFDDGFTPAEYLLTDVQQHGQGETATESFEVISDDGRYMCSLCDEAVNPQPLRYCESCGHDFGEGIEVAASEGGTLGNRATLLMVFLSLIGAGIAAYYWFVLR